MLSLLLNSTKDNTSCFHHLCNFLSQIIHEIDNLAAEIQNDDALLISIKNQKLLQTCFQLITSLGIAPSLIPGLGIDLMKRCSSASILPNIKFNDDQKHEMLVYCADFFTRSYKIPVLKNIIMTLHLVDYLAVLIQLTFAPLKKPGTYNNYIMTQDRYNELSLSKQKYLLVYEDLVANCFQPTLMKELLVLQSATEPQPPAFARRIIAKEMSQRLMAPGGLLSLIRCFIESYNIDTGFEWRKIDMVSKIVAVKHGNDTEDAYLQNICSQLIQILSLNNPHYLATAVACTLTLYDKYSKSDHVKGLVRDVFESFDHEKLVFECNLPGTVILSPEEVEHKINVLYAGICLTKVDCPATLLLPNLYILFSLGVICTKSEEIQTKLKALILKTLEQVDKQNIKILLSQLLFGKDTANNILIEEYEAGLAIKYITSDIPYHKEKSLLYFLTLFKAATDSSFVEHVFEALLEMLIEINIKRQTKPKKDLLFGVEDDPIIFDTIDEQYVSILQILSEISTTPKVLSSLKRNPSAVLYFIEHFILKSSGDYSDECTSIALVLLNTILSNSNKVNDLINKLKALIPRLKTMSEDDSSYNSILSKEALNLLSFKETPKRDTEFGKAITNIFDELMPVRAHGIIALTKLIDAKDPETISKKHYVFCIFQEHLKNPDSYMYLSAINGIASLGSHCTEEVLYTLCKEFLNVSNEDQLETKDIQNKISELRMKIGDIIVKVTKRFGEMAIVHKTLLLNTMLCACRDDDPLIRTSALSNLAEIVLVMHYKVGSIIYEILHCVWCILETDKAIECRRAAVMVISSLIKGLGKEILVELKENLLPIYRTLKELYQDTDEDPVLRLHAQIALEELNETVKEFLFPKIKMEKQFFVLDKPHDFFK